MNADCPNLDARSRKTLSLLLKAIADTGQRPLAEKLGIDESTMTRLKDLHLPRFALMLTTLGFKPVPIGNKVNSPEYVAALQLLARKGLDSPVEELDTQINWSKSW